MRELWERTDSNSTIELLSLGSAIETAQTFSNDWLKGCIRDLKRADSPILNGPLFELNLISWLANGKMQVLPTPYAHKGIDLILKVSDDKELLVSLKNFDMSGRERSFQTQCEGLRQKCREVFPPRGYLGTRVIFTASEYFNSDRDWEKIKSIIEQWPQAEGVATFSPPSYPQVEVAIYPFSSNGAHELAQGWNSDDLFATMPWHDEEPLHYKRKIEGAVADLRSACRNSSDLKGLFIRLHQSARIEDLIGLAESATKDQDIDLIMYYQPAYITELTQNSTSPSFYMVYASSERWKRERKEFNFQVLIGTVLNKPTKLKLLRSNFEMTDMPPNLYFYFRGQHFIFTEAGPDGSATFNFTRRPNLAVYPIFNGTPIVGVSPPHDDFLIL